MKKGLIEMVCMGNRTRSASAELVAKNHLEKIGAARDYGVVSSGVNVNQIKNGEFSEEEIREFVDQSVDVGLDKGYGRLSEIVNSIKNGEYSEEMKMEFIGLMWDLEGKERDLALKYFGIGGEAKQTSDQTIVKPDRYAILPVCSKTHKYVNGIYQESGYDPKIHILSALATGNDSAEIGGSILPGESYRDVIQRSIGNIVEHTPKAIDKLLDEAA